MIYTPEKVTHSSFIERVIERMKVLGLTTTQVALQADIKEATFKNILYKNTEVGRSTLIMLASVLQTTVEYLSTGVHTDSDSDSVSLAVLSPEGLARSLEIIHESENSAAIEPTFHSIPLPRKALDRYNILPEYVRAVSINTQSLAPTLSQNDVALVDIGCKKFSEGVFIICIRDSVIIRHVSPVSKGFAFSSTNAHIYGTTASVDTETGDLTDPHIKIVGRIFSKILIRDI